MAAPGWSGNAEQVWQSLAMGSGGLMKPIGQTRPTLGLGPWLRPFGWWSSAPSRLSGAETVALPIPMPPGAAGSVGRPSPDLSLVGVGPGDPEQLTVAAVRAIAEADLVAYPVAREGGEGMAATIAAPWIAPHQQRLPLLFPMTEEPEPRRRAWDAAADRQIGRAHV